ncbi:hypothetical protein ACFVVM_03770 [Nocardia sp. NPDC058176]|uniref:hypothetical protein n=1 Tax=Nocardia sp. NPDC058176 TaxID=3346368 RepID=UPI0036DAF124
MQREHEELMRDDFARYIGLSEQVEQGLFDRDNPIPTEQRDALHAQQDELRGRWEQGPHAEHWNYLSDAHDDWKRSPKVMARMLDDIAHNGGAGVSEVEERSQAQAAALVARSAERQPERRVSKQARSGIERGR